MPRSRCAEEQMLRFVEQADAGVHAAEPCRKEGFGAATLYKQRARFGGTEAGDAKRLRQLEGGNVTLEMLLAEVALDDDALKMGFEAEH